MKNSARSNITIIASFLLLEVLAFLSFGLSNSIIVYGIIGLAIFILVLIGTKQELKNKGFTSLAFFLIPLLIFGLINFLSPFTLGAYKDDGPIFVSFMILIAFLTFSVVGYLSSKIETFKMDIAIECIYGGLALVTIIGYLMSMIQFCPFYTYIYRNYYIYFDGAKSQEAIGNIAYSLMGFKLQEVSVSYFTFFPAVLSSSTLGLFFISPRAEKKKFIRFVCYALAGLIPLITTPSKTTIAALLLILISDTFIVLVGKKYVKTRVISLLTKIIVPIASILFIVMIVNASKSVSMFNGIQNLISSNRLLNKIFNTNPIITKYNDILELTFAEGTFVGFFPIAEYTSSLFLNSSSSVLIDTIMTSGFIGLIFFIFFAIKGFMSVINYYNKSDDSILRKTLILGFVLTFIFYSSLSYDMTPYIYYPNFIPCFTSGLFLVLLFFVGYSYKVVDMKKEETINE